LTRDPRHPGTAIAIYQDGSCSISSQKERNFIMYASTQDRHVSFSWLFRNCGRLGGVIVMASWAGMVIMELFRTGAPSSEAMQQGVPLAIVFAGYIIGWRKELVGGLLAIVGTIAFYLVSTSTVGSVPQPAAAWLAAPGVFYLIARAMDVRATRKLV
jgi:hypothetical protein